MFFGIRKAKVALKTVHLESKPEWPKNSQQVAHTKYCSSLKKSTVVNSYVSPYIFTLSL